MGGDGPTVLIYGTRPLTYARLYGTMNICTNGHRLYGTMIICTKEERPGFSSAAQARRRKLRLQNMSAGNTCGYISKSACVSMRGWCHRPVALYYCISILHSPAYQPLHISHSPFISLSFHSISNLSNVSCVGGTAHAPSSSHSSLSAPSSIL